MADELVAADIRDFIIRHIDSVTQLEALLLLRGNPERRWDLPGMAERLYASEQEVAEVLTLLRDDGLVSVHDGIYQYEFGTEQRRALVDRLAQVYARQLIPVTNMIHAKPRRIRQFADAFRFRKDR